jgi:hypothetical protein
VSGAAAAPADRLIFSFIIMELRSIRARPPYTRCAPRPIVDHASAGNDLHRRTVSEPCIRTESPIAASRHSARVAREHAVRFTRVQGAHSSSITTTSQHATIAPEIHKSVRAF